MCNTCSHFPVRHEEVLHHMEKAMKDFIGLETLKQQFLRFTRTQLQNDRRKRLGRQIQQDTPLHQIFAGNRGTGTLRNRTCRYASLVHANFSVNQMRPIIYRWKLVKHRYCFGDNRRTKDNRKIKLCGLKAC